MADRGDSRSGNLAAVPFVGRERELDLLRHVCQQVIQGQSGTVLVSGEAGIGKTALVHHLVNEARERGALVLSGNVYDLSATPPYGPWLELLQNYESHKQDETFPDPPSFLQDRDELAKMQSQEALFQEVFKFLSFVAEKIPLVLLLEDLHWSDQSSLDLLRFVARRSRECSILVGATYRDDEVTRGHALYQLLPILVRETNAERIELRALDKRDVRNLIKQYYPLDKPSHERLTQYLLRRAQGHPMFTIELLRTLEFSGVVRKNDGDWTLGDLEQETVPGLIHQIVDRRMSAFSEEAHTAMQKAAAIGYNVSFEDWALVTDLDTVMSASARALESHLLDESPDGRGVSFHHALVREAVYAGMVLPLRLKVHIEVAEAFLSQPDPDPDTVAYHLQRAGDPRAAEWLIRAGEKAESRLAFLEACERYKQAVESVQRDAGNARQTILLLLKIATLLRLLDPSLSVEYFRAAREAALEAGERGAAAYALFRIGYNRSNLRDVDRGLEDMRNGVRAMVDAPEDVHRIGRWFATSWMKAITSVEEGIGTLAFILAVFGRYQEALETAKQCLIVDWRQTGPSTSLEAITQASVGSTEGVTGTGVALANLGQPEVAQLAYRMFENVSVPQSAHTTHLLFANTYLICLHFPYRTLELNERHEHAGKIEGRLKISSGMTDSANATCGYEHYLLHTGRWTDLFNLIRSREPPRIFGFWSVSMAARARFALYKGEYDHASEILHGLLPQGPETLPHDNVHLLPGHAHRTAVELAIETGDLVLAREWIEAHDRWLDWSGAVSGRAEGLLLRGKIHLAEDNIDLARDYARRAVTQANDPQQPMALIAIHRFIGELESVAGNLSGAEQHLRQALELVEAGALPFEHALTLLAMAGLELARDDLASARDLLARVREICIPLSAQPTLARAAALEAQIAGRTIPEPERSDKLTERELDVLRLIASGRSNRQIAGDLFISTRTVERHIANIYTKIHVHNRVEATAYALRDHLV